TLDLEGWRIPFDHTAAVHLCRDLHATRPFWGVAVATGQDAVDEIAAALDRALRVRAAGDGDGRNKSEHPTDHASSPCVRCLRILQKTSAAGRPRQPAITYVLACESSRRLRGARR